MKRLSFLILPFILVWNSCSKEDVVTQEQPPSVIQYQNEPDLVDALVLEITQEDNGFTAYYYGSTNGSGFASQINSIVTRRSGSDTTFNFLLDDNQRVEYSYIEIYGQKDSKLHRWMYPSQDSVYYLILEKDWETQEDSIIFFAASSITNGEFESQVYLPRLAEVDEWLPGQAAIAQGLYTATGVVTSAAVGVLGSTINPMLGAMGALIVFHAFFDDNANAGELEETANPAAPPSPEPTAEELEEDPCENVNFSVTVGVDPGYELVALPTGSADSPFSFHWSTGENGTSEAFHSIVAPSPGEYSVMVETASGCVAVGQVTVEPDCSNSDLAVYITEGNGTLTAVGSGGEGSYTYLWSNGSTNAAISGVSIGNYEVTITDEYGCTATATYSAGCNGLQVEIVETVGSLTASVSGGTPPYSYSWSNGAAGQVLANHSEQTYSITVIDALGCEASANIDAGGSLTFNTTETLDTTGAVVSITVTVNGPAGNYTLTWGAYCFADDFWTYASNPVGYVNGGTLHNTYDVYAQCNQVGVNLWEPLYEGSAPVCVQGGGESHMFFMQETANGYEYVYLWTSAGSCNWTQGE